VAMKDRPSRIKIQIINGPNLNILGQREKDIYGEDSLLAIQSYVEEKIKGLPVALSWFQSNIEGEIVNEIQRSLAKEVALLVINPGGYSHTSVAIYDALKALPCKKVEVHLTNTHKREDFRRNRITAGAVDVIIEGAGKDSYLLAILSQTF